MDQSLRVLRSCAPKQDVRNKLSKNVKSTEVVQVKKEILPFGRGSASKRRKANQEALIINKGKQPVYELSDSEIEQAAPKSSRKTDLIPPEEARDMALAMERSRHETKHYAKVGECSGSSSKYPSQKSKPKMQLKKVRQQGASLRYRSNFNNPVQPVLMLQGRRGPDNGSHGLVQVPHSGNINNSGSYPNVPVEHENKAMDELEIGVNIQQEPSPQFVISRASLTPRNVRLKELNALHPRVGLLQHMETLPMPRSVHNRSFSPRRQKVISSQTANSPGLSTQHIAAPDHVPAVPATDSSHASDPGCTGTKPPPLRNGKEHITPFLDGEHLAGHTDAVEKLESENSHQGCGFKMTLRPRKQTTGGYIRVIPSAQILEKVQGRNCNVTPQERGINVAQGSGLQGSGSLHEQDIQGEHIIVGGDPEQPKTCTCGFVSRKPPKHLNHTGPRRRNNTPGRHGGRKKKDTNINTEAVHFYNYKDKLEIGVAFQQREHFRIAVIAEAEQQNKKIRSVGSNQVNINMVCKVPGCKFRVVAANHVLRNQTRKIKLGQAEDIGFGHESKPENKNTAGYYKIVVYDEHTCGDSKPPEELRELRKKCSYGHGHCEVAIQREPLNAAQCGFVLVNEMNKAGLNIMTGLTVEVARKILEPMFQKCPENLSQGDGNKPPLSQRKLKRAVNIAKDSVRGTWKESLQGLDWMKKEFEAAHPKNHLDVKWQETASGNNALQCIKFCFGGVVEGYKYLRKHLYLDATFLNGPLKGTLFCVVGADADGGQVVLCGMIAGNESTETWTEMVTYLLTHYPDVTRPEWTWVSDRSKGLAAAEQLCGDAHVHHCILHFKRNILNWKGLAKWERRKLLKFAHVAACTTSVIQFRAALRELGKPLEDLLTKNHPMQNWVATMWPTYSYGVYVSNNVESFFSCILRLGWKSCHFGELIFKIHNWQVLKFRKTHSEFLKMLGKGDTVPPKVAAQASYAQMMSSNIHYQGAATDDNGTITVYLHNPSLLPPYNNGCVTYDRKKECHFKDCHYMELTGYPCVHAFASYRKVRGVKYQDLFAPELTLRSGGMFYVNALKDNNLVNEFQVWNLSEEARGIPVCTPKFTKPRQPGRPKEHRYTSCWEDVKQTTSKQRKKGAFYATRKWLIARDSDDPEEREAVEIMQQMVNESIASMNSTQDPRMSRFLVRDLEATLDQKGINERLLNLLLIHQSRRRRIQQQEAEEQRRSRARTLQRQKTPNLRNVQYQTITLEVIPYVDPNSVENPEDSPVELDDYEHALTDDEEIQPAPPIIYMPDNNWGNMGTNVDESFRNEIDGEFDATLSHATFGTNNLFITLNIPIYRGRVCRFR